MGLVAGASVISHYGVGSHWSWTDSSSIKQQQLYYRQHKYDTSYVAKYT
jgi:hypothetical protein